MRRVKLKSPIELVHHAAKSKERRERLAVDSEEFAEVAEQGKMRVGATLVSRDGQLTQRSPLLKMREPRRAVRRGPSPFAFLQRLTGKITGRVLGRRSHRLKKKTDRRTDRNDTEFRGGHRINLAERASSQNIVQYNRLKEKRLPAVSDHESAPS